MGAHTFDPEMADRLEEPSRFRFCSREELVQHLPRDGTVLDHGSGTGFYTDELAPYVDRLVGMDLQPVMHDRYRERGVPDNVELVTGRARSLPFDVATVDGILSVMTFHEMASDAALSELRRVLSGDAPLVVVDWSAEGAGDAGPPLDDRYTAIEAGQSLTTNGFTVRIAAERTETFLIVAEHATATEP